MCSCRERLLAAAADLMDDAGKARRDRHPNNAAWIERRAMGYGAAAGLLATKEHNVTETILVTITPCSKGSSCRLDDGHSGVCRDRFARPLIVPPGGTKPVAYTRATTFVDCIEDKFKLSQWGKRMVAVGLADRPDYLLAVAAQRDDRDALDVICEQALTAAKANDKRDRGTLLHALSEIVDADAELPPETTDADRSAIYAYVEATRCLRHLHVERLTVVDSIKVAGTPDRISHYAGIGPDGKTPIDGNFIVDLKSGNNDFGQLKNAGQLAVYSRAEFLDIETWERTPLPDVNQEWGIIVALDAENATAELRWIDLTLGWDGVTRLASQVRAMRNQARTAMRPFVVPVADLTPTADLMAQVEIASHIAQVPTVEALNALWAARQVDFTPELVALAKARAAALAGAG